jgi:hypothetical protein
VNFPGDESCRAAGSVHEDESIGQDDMAATERGSMTEFIEIRGRARTTSGTCLFACSTRSLRKRSVSSTRTPACSSEASRAATHSRKPTPSITSAWLHRRPEAPGRGLALDGRNNHRHLHGTSPAGLMPR